jgi:hypothetical protein
MNISLLNILLSLRIIGIEVLKIDGLMPYASFDNGIRMACSSSLFELSLNSGFGFSFDIFYIKYIIHTLKYILSGFTSK